MTPANNAAWAWLQQELDRWSRSGLKARFWWRDDDAAKATTQLARLLSLCQDFDARIALAVIPRDSEDSLVDLINQFQNVSVLQHGYSHHNHAPPGQLKLELGGTRLKADLMADVSAGFQTLEARFNKQFCPVMVPPWNRIDDNILADLGEIGLRGLSTFRVRKQPFPVPGLLQVNAHLDPVHWRRQNKFIGVYPAIAILVQDLIAKRTGYRDINEPTGILSHHLAYDDTTWRFTETLLGFLSTHPAASWIGADQIWAPENP